jgi:GT2 family glycosyltransferase
VLTALTQQDHARIEVIVVADPDAAEQVRARGLHVKIVPFDAANVAAARNAGILLAGAPVVAFVDDDAVPEPTWASRLAAPFADARVMQAGGYVRGRNGISFQWRAMAVDATGRDHPVELPDEVTLHAGLARRAIKTQGTNCAFRRSALLAVGGFDPVFRFYLDDADLNLRLAARGGLTAVVPRAEVHHGFSASNRRRADRAPLSLRDIGASTAIFLRRHAPERIGPALDDLRAKQRCRLLVGLQDGRLEPRDVAGLLASLEQGIAEGSAKPPMPPAPLAACETFLPLPRTGARPGHVIAGPRWHARRLARRAAEEVAGGAVVTVLAIGLLPRRHRMWFDPAGVWWQSGGLRAASDRRDPVLRLWGWRARIAREARRLPAVRPVGELDGNACHSALQDAVPGHPKAQFQKCRIEHATGYWTVGRWGRMSSAAGTRLLSADRAEKT